MRTLKKIPAYISAELHETRIINLTADKKEVQEKIPQQLDLVDYEGSAFITLMSTVVKHVFPDFYSPKCSFNLQHATFLALVRPENKPEFSPQWLPLRSFWADRNGCGGVLHKSSIRNEDGLFELKDGDDFIHYALDESSINEIEVDDNLINTVQCLNHVNGNEAGSIPISCNLWSFRPVECYHFATTFYPSIKLESAFMLEQVVRTNWIFPYRDALVNAIQHKSLRLA